MEKRFEQMQLEMDKRFEQVDKRFDVLFMVWSFGVTLMVGGLVVAVIKFLP